MIAVDGFVLINCATYLWGVGVELRERFNLEWLPIELIDFLAEEAVALLANLTGCFIGILSHPSEI